MEEAIELYQGNPGIYRRRPKTKIKSGETKPIKVGSLERLTQDYLTVNDLISENLKNLDKTLGGIKRLDNENMKYELDGLAITLTAYKLKQFQGERYFQGRLSDRFIEARYLSIILNWINTTIGKGRKKPEKVRDKLYAIVEKLIKDDKISEKERHKLDPRNRIYNALTKRFTYLDTEHIKENLILIGKVFDSTKQYSKREDIEKELLRYKHLPDEKIRAMETGFVAQRICNEEEIIIRDALADSLTDKFK